MPVADSTGGWTSSAARAERHARAPRHPARTRAQELGEDLPRLRSLIGQSTAIWAGASGVEVETGRWLALSGARGVDYNVVLCHEATGGEAIRSSIAEINLRRAPGLIMVAGTALADVQHLVNEGWVCVGSVPLMARELDPDMEPEPSAQRIAPGELDAVRVLVEQAFDVGPELALVALPDAALTAAGQSVWAVRDEHGELVSCLGAVVVEDAVVVWSMATSPRHRRAGHGARLLRGMLADAAGSGVSRALLQSAPDAELFYRSIGYVALERWQLWSRPRWVLGHA